MSYYVSCDSCEKSVINGDGKVIGDNVFCEECYKELNDNHDNVDV